MALLWIKLSLARCAGRSRNSLTEVFVYNLEMHPSSCRLKVVLAFAIVVLLLQSACTARKVKVLIMSSDIKITSMTYSQRSTGSIDPDSYAYETEWTYSPTKEESDKIIDEVRINSEWTLREFFEAQNKGDEKKLKEMARDTSSDKPIEYEPGSTATYWSITSNVGAVSNSTREYGISSFPKVVFEKGKEVGKNAQGIPEGGLLPHGIEDEVKILPEESSKDHGSLFRKFKDLLKDKKPENKG